MFYGDYHFLYWLRTSYEICVVTRRVLEWNVFIKLDHWVGNYIVNKKKKNFIVKK